MNRQTTVLPANAESAISRAVDMLHQGRLVAFPTETVYGLGADATREGAVARIFDAKVRPSFNPLIVHVANRGAAQNLAIWNDRAERLSATLWPGPLTLVLHRRADIPISKLASAGLETIAIRVPNHPVAAQLLEAVDRPIAAPSANPSGQLSPTTAEHVRSALNGKIDLILDAGPCLVGLESTIIDVSGDAPILLRPGGTPVEKLTEILDEPIESALPGEVRAPGMLSQHYSPSTPMRLNAQKAEAGEILLWFGPDAPETEYNLSARGDLLEAAANLFALLHRLDALNADRIAVAPVPDVGLGRAINDRLQRAAAAV